MKLVFNCTTCGKEILRTPAEAKRNKSGKRFCSYDCHNEHQEKGGVWLTCPTCKKEFRIRAYRLKTPLNRVNKISCSHKCHLEYFGRNPKSIACDMCGEEFTRKRAEIKEHNFCSRKCMGEWQSKFKAGENSPTWRGGYKGYYGKDWCRNKRKARRRDKFTCRGCKLTQKDAKYTLEVHHIKPARLFNDVNKSNHLDNLLTLCRPCHTKADVLARWFFDNLRRQTELTHPLQNNRNIGWVYFDSK